MKIRSHPAFLILLGFLAAANPADAHVINTGLGPLYDGATHLALSPENFVPVIALGLFAGLRGATIAKRSLCVLPLAWMIGGLVASAWFPAAISFPWTAVSFLILGLLIATDAPLKIHPTTALSVLLGLLHGGLEGSARSTEMTGTLSALGSALLAALLFLLASGLVLALKPHWTRIAIRVIGSWITATGLLLLGWRFHR